jgi:tetratricopeptide (TPR) repeat protein
LEAKPLPQYQTSRVTIAHGRITHTNQSSSKSTHGSFLCLSLTAIIPAQQQQPKTAHDYVLEAIAAQRAGNHVEAVRLYAEALRLNPKDFGAQFNSGSSYMVLRKFEDALTAFKAAAAIRPEEAHVQFALGSAYAATGHSLEAIDAFREAIRLCDCDCQDGSAAVPTIRLRKRSTNSLCAWNFGT